MTIVLAYSAKLFVFWIGQLQRHPKQDPYFWALLCIFRVPISQPMGWNQPLRDHNYLIIFEISLNVMRKYFAYGGGRGKNGLKSALKPSPAWNPDIARWALMHCFLSVCLSVRLLLDNNSYLEKYYSYESETLPQYPMPIHHLLMMDSMVTHRQGSLPTSSCIFTTKKSYLFRPLWKSCLAHQ